MPTAPIASFTATRLDPYLNPAGAQLMDVNLKASTTFAAGQVLGELAATPGTFAPYAPPTASPTAAPGLAAATGTSPGAGAWLVAYSYVTATGETLASPAASVTVTGSQEISVTGLGALPTGVLSVNWYMSREAGTGELGLVANNNGAAFNLTAAPAVDADAPPAANSATAASDGSQNPKLILQYACITDASGNITLGAGGIAAGGAEWQQTFKAAPAYRSGTFLAADITGLDANAIAVLGRIVSTGVFTMYGT